MQIKITGKINKNKRIILTSVLLILVSIIIWSSEIIGISYHLSGVSTTLMYWAEATFLTLVLVLVGIIISFIDNKFKKAADELKYISYHNILTGLCNRAYLEEELKRIDTCRQLPISIILGDVNNLKLVNDTFGHKEGDRLLIKIAEMLKAFCRKEDVIARWGGDEFLILLPQTTGNEAEEIKDRLRNAFKGTSELKVPASISLGVSTKEKVSQDIQTTIRRAEDNMYRRKLLEEESTSSSIIKSLEIVLLEKSHETKEHAERMKKLALKLGCFLGLPENELDKLLLLSSLHDIGKVGVSDEILLKKGELTKREWENVKKHSEVGYKIAKSAAAIAHIADGILFHHERWDGTGYPCRLKGEDIPTISRILSIVDAYDVMTNGRVYKKKLSKKEAIKELNRCAGTQFDPELTEKFINIIKV